MARRRREGPRRTGHPVVAILSFVTVLAIFVVAITGSLDDGTITGAAVQDGAGSQTSEDPGFFAQALSFLRSVVSFGAAGFSAALSDPLVVLNSTFGLNTTAENLTAHVTPADNATLKNIIDWRTDGNSFATLNLPFEAHNSTFGGYSYGTRPLHIQGYNGATFSSTGGHDGRGAYTFDGNDYLRRFGTNWLIDNEWSVESWHKQSSAVNDDTIWQIGESFTGGAATNNTIKLVSNYVIVTDQDSTVFNDFKYYSGIPTSTAWTHTVVTWDGTDLLVYRNGQDITSTLTKNADNAGTMTSTNRNLWVGVATNDGGNSLSDYFVGTIDGVWFYPRALTSEQILLRYQNSTDLFSGETRVGEDWQACVVANNGSADSTQQCSENLTVLGTASTAINSVTLASAAGANGTNEYLQVAVDPAANATRTNNVDWRLNGTSWALLNVPFEANEAGDTVVKDYSQFGNDGVAIGKAGPGPVFNASGGYDGTGAFEFDGVNDYISFGDVLDFNGTDAFSIAYWVNPANVGASVFHIAKEDNYNKGEGYHTAIIAGGTVRLELRSTSNSDRLIVDTNTTLAADSWTHLAVTYDGSSSAAGVAWYFNGVAQPKNVIADNLSLSTITSEDLQIGCREDCTASRFNGSIDDLLIFNHTLSAEQALSLYNRGLERVVAEETSVNDTWQVCATGNDGVRDGSQVCSNNLTVVFSTVGKYTAPSDAGTGAFIANGSINGTLIGQNIYAADQYVTFQNESQGRRLQVYARFSTDEVNLNTVVINTSQNATAVDASGATGINSTFSMYVPDTGAGVTACPQATTLAALGSSCSGAVGFTHADALAGVTRSGYTIAVDGPDYRIDNLTGTGLVQGVNVNLSIFDDTNDPEGLNQTYYPADSVGFYANFTKGFAPANTTDGACLITYNVSGTISGPFSMTYNTSTSLFGRERSFSSFGTFLFSVNCTDAGESLFATDNFTITSPVRFAQRSFSRNVSRVENARIKLELRNYGAVAVDNVTGSATQVSAELPIGFIGALYEGNTLDLPAGTAFNGTVGLTFGRATADNYTFNVSLTSTDFAETLDEVPVTVFLPPLTEQNYNISVTPQTIAVDITDKDTAGTICTDTTAVISITNIGQLNISDLRVTRSGDLPVRATPDSVTDYVLRTGQQFNITVYALINESTPSSSTVFNISAGVISRTVNVSYTKNASLVGWAPPPTLASTTLSFGPALTSRCTNGVGYDATISIPEVFDLGAATSARFLTTFAEWTCPDGVASSANLSVNENVVLSATPYGTVSSSFNPNILAHENNITMTSAPPGGHYCAAGSSTIQVNFSSTSSTYCQVCSPGADEEANFTDGLDNDCDLFEDCDDPDSCGAAACVGAGGLYPIHCPEQEDCSDGLDNDGNGLTDCEDVGVCCSAGACTSSFACNNLPDLICDYGNYNTLCVLRENQTIQNLTSPVSLRDLEFRSGATYNIGQFRVDAAGDVEIQNGVLINGDGRGYTYGTGPGAPSGTAGASYGGEGGGAATGTYYDSALKPDDMGSGGGPGEFGFVGGKGGGLFSVSADTFTNDGAIDLDGTAGTGSVCAGCSWWGGGAGGGVYVNASYVYGSGTYSADGGAYAHGSFAGGGAGGRMAIHANNVGSLDSSKFSVDGYGLSGALYPGGNGTIVWYDKDDDVLYVPASFRFESGDYPTVVNYGRMVFQSAAAKSDANLTFNVTDWTMDADSSLSGESTQGININITASNNVTLNDVDVSTLIINAPLVHVRVGGVVDGAGRGYGARSGPGTGLPTSGSGSGGGGAYGADGGQAGSGGGSFYGSALVPDDTGSGGGSSTVNPTQVYGGRGGGLLRVSATQFVNDGAISMDGTTGTGSTCVGCGYAGGGAGGGIFINVSNISGSGTYAARGGNAGHFQLGGSGGGGRIAIWADDVSGLDPAGFNASAGAVGTRGGPGTIVWYDRDDDVIYAQNGYRAETADLMQGTLQRTGFVASGIPLIRLGDDTFLNMSSTLRIVNSTFTSDSFTLKMRSPVVTLNGSLMNVSMLDIVYDTSFSDDGTTYLATLASLRIERTGTGSVNFTQATNVHNLSRHVTFASNQVRVNSSAVSGLNTSATITLVTSFSTQPVPKWDPEDDGTFVMCPASVCTPVSFNAVTGEFTFNVTHFTGFSSGFDAALTIFDENDPEGGSQGKTVGQSVGFFANYTNSSSGAVITGAACNITVPLVVNSTAMTFNVSGTDLYEFSTAFVQNGTFAWNVSCLNTVGFANLSANDTVLIGQAIGPVPEFGTWAMIVLVMTALAGVALFRRRP